MIVADTNLIAYLLIKSGNNRMAASALRIDPEWAAPRLWRSEFNNIVAGYMRRGELDLVAASVTVSRARSLMAGQEYEVAPGPVLDLVSQSKCSAYDCEFVALAQDLSVQLVSNDARLVAAFPDRAVSLADFVQDAPPPAAADVTA